MKIIDNIIGEISYCSNKQDAIKVAQKRVKFHNSNFTYGHRGHHYSVNATYKVDGNVITIYKE